MTLRFNATLIFILIAFSVSAQTSDLPIGGWRIYQRYKNAAAVAQSDNYVYWSTGQSILRLNKQDQSTERWDKSNHLTQSGISRIAFDKANNTLIVVYTDNAIDLVSTNGTRTLTDIKNNNAIVGDKNIYQIYTGGSVTYLACGFGLVGLDVARSEFKFTTFTKQRINSVTVLQNAVYVANNSGIYTIAENTKSNIADFNNWRRLGIAEGFSNAYTTTLLSNFNNTLYFNYNDSLCYLSAASKIKSVINAPTLIPKYITSEGKYLLAGFDCSTGCLIKGYSISAQNIASELSSTCFGSSTNAIEDANGKIWFADDYLNFRSLANVNAKTCATVEYDSPFLTSSANITLNDTAVWFASTALNGINPSDESEGFSLFQNNQWTNYNSLYTPAIQNNPEAGGDNFDVSINSITQKVYVSSFRKGLIELQNGAITKFYDRSNSPICASPLDPSRQRVTGLHTDTEGNVWVINSLCANPILVLNPTIRG